MARRNWTVKDNAIGPFSSHSSSKRSQLLTMSGRILIFMSFTLILFNVPFSFQVKHSTVGCQILCSLVSVLYFYYCLIASRLQPDDKIWRIVLRITCIYSWFILYYVIIYWYECQVVEGVIALLSILLMVKVKSSVIMNWLNGAKREVNFRVMSSFLVKCFIMFQLCRKDKY